MTTECERTKSRRKKPEEKPDIGDTIRGEVRGDHFFDSRRDTSIARRALAQSFCRSAALRPNRAESRNSGFCLG